MPLVIACMMNVVEMAMVLAPAPLSHCRSKLMHAFNNYFLFTSLLKHQALCFVVFLDEIIAFFNNYAYDWSGTYMN